MSAIQSIRIVDPTFRIRVEWPDSPNKTALWMYIPKHLQGSFPHHSILSMMRDVGLLKRNFVWCRSYLYNLPQYYACMAVKALHLFRQIAPIPSRFLTSILRHPLQVSLALEELQNAGIHLEESEVEALLDNAVGADKIASIFIILKEFNLYTPQNRNQVLNLATHLRNDASDSPFFIEGIPHFQDLHTSIWGCHRETPHLFDQALFDAFCQNPDKSYKIMLIIWLLDRRGLLTDAVRKQPEVAWMLHLGFKELVGDWNGEPSDADCQFLLQCPKHADKLAYGLNKLRQANLDNELYRNALLKHAEFAHLVAQTIIWLNIHGLLSEKNFQKLIGNEDIEAACHSIESLHWNYLLNQNNVQQILLGKGAHARFFLKALKKHDQIPLNEIENFTQAEFNCAMQSAWMTARLAATGIAKLPIPLDSIARSAAMLMPDYSEDENPPMTAYQIYTYLYALLNKNQPEPGAPQE